MDSSMGRPFPFGSPLAAEGIPKATPRASLCPFERQGELLVCPVCKRTVKAEKATAVCRKSPLPPRPGVPSAPTYGAGTELKALLKTVGITATPNCSCNSRARTMDTKGVKWCEENIETISGWLKEESARRKLPYSEYAGKTLINLAIRRAKKREAEEARSRT